MKIPREKTLDGALSLLRDGNEYIMRRCDAYNADIFETRLLFKKTFCVRGEEATQVFYTRGRLTRQGAIPPTVLRLLQDKGSVATLNDEAHRWRKRMMMSLMSAASVHRLVELMDKRWRREISRWETKAEVDLFDDVQRILCGAVCEWCGVHVNDDELPERTREVAAMIDGAGAIGPRSWRGMILRRRFEKWLTQKIKNVREQSAEAPSGDVMEVDPIKVIALHRDISGDLLHTEVAAVEVLNLIRPTVAVARFILFSAIALHTHPQFKQKLREEDSYRELFVQEVRRFYPFFPFVGGIVREGFEWRNQHFVAGTRLMLDIYGTNHDPRIWNEPEQFNPDRFRAWQENPFSFIAQGGGDFYANHRCAGESLTIELIKRSVLLLTEAMDYEVCAQDVTINMQRMPALPKKPFMICKVRHRQSPHDPSHETD